MKHLFIFISMLFCLSTIAFAGSNIPLNHQPNGSVHEGKGKAPIAPWYIYQDGYVLTMSATPCDYTLTLYDEDGDVFYTTYLPSGTTQVVLPTTLSGTFEICFEAETYYYYGYINL